MTTNHNRTIYRRIAHALNLELLAHLLASTPQETPAATILTIADLTAPHWLAHNMHHFLE